jgi:hypothetical protein
MAQSSSPALPDVLARRLMQEQELQQVIKNELMRRKLIEHSSADSHKFFLDPSHNLRPKPPDFAKVGISNSVFTGIIGKGVGYPVGSERSSVQTDKSGKKMILSSMKAHSEKRVQPNVKLHSNDRLRQNRLQDMLLEEQLEQSISSAWGSCDKKAMSPRKERENLSNIMSPRKHVLKLNLGALTTSPAVEHSNLVNPRGSFTERQNGDSSRFVIAFTSARSAGFEGGSATLTLKPSSFQNNSDCGTKTHEIIEALPSQSNARGVGFQQSNNCFQGKRACEVKSYSTHSHISKAVFSDFPHIMGSAAPPGLISKINSLRSILTNPVSCHVPVTPEHPTAHIYSHTPSTDRYLPSSRDAHDWNDLILKYESHILKPKPQI